MKKAILLAAVSSLLLAATAQAENLGTLQENIGVGKTMSVGLSNSPTGSWFATIPNDTGIVRATINQNNMVITGLKAGTTTVLGCAVLQSTNCVTVNVTVSSVLGATTGTHAVGSWVISNGTIYYVAANGLIPVPTWKIFLSNGGKSSKVVPANTADLNLPLLPLMVSHDSRVK